MSSFLTAHQHNIGYAVPYYFSRPTNGLLLTFCDSVMRDNKDFISSWCLGGAVVRRRTRDRKVAGSTPAARALSSQLGQLSLPSLRGR